MRFRPKRALAAVVFAGVLGEFAAIGETGKASAQERNVPPPSDGSVFSFSATPTASETLELGVDRLSQQLRVR